MREPARMGATGSDDSEEEEDDDGGIASRLRDAASSATDSASDAVESARDATESVADRADSAAETAEESGSSSQSDNNVEDAEQEREKEESSGTESDGDDSIRDRVSDRVNDGVDQAREIARDIDAGRTEIGTVDRPDQGELSAQQVADADPRIEEDDVRLRRGDDEVSVLVGGDTERRFEEGVAGQDARENLSLLGGSLAQGIGGAADAAGEIDAPTSAVSSTADSVEGALGLDVVEDDVEGPRSRVARTQTGPIGSQARAQAAEETGFSEDSITVRETDDGVVASVDDDARVDRVEQQILDERDELQRGDIDVSVEDGEVVAETPPEFDSDLPFVGDRVEQFRAGQFRRGERIDDVRSDLAGVGPFEQFESDGLISREEAAGAGALATATPEPASTAAGLGVLGLVGAATAVEETRQAGQQDRDRLVVEDGAEIDVVEEERAGEIPAESNIGTEIAELGIGDAAQDVAELGIVDAAQDVAELDIGDRVEQQSEIETPSQQQLKNEIDITGGESSVSGTIQTQQLIGGRATSEEEFQEDEQSEVIEEDDGIVEEVERREREELRELARQGQLQAEYEVEQEYGDVRDDIDVIERDTETDIVNIGQPASEDIQRQQDVTDIPIDDLTPFQRQTLRGRLQTEEDATDQQLIEESQQILDQDQFLFPGERVSELAEETQPRLEQTPQTRSTETEEFADILGEGKPRPDTRARPGIDSESRPDVGRPGLDSLNVGVGTQSRLNAEGGLNFGFDFDANFESGNPNARPTQNATTNQTGQAEGLGQAFNVGQGGGFRGSGPRFRPRIPSTEGGSYFGSEGVSDRDSDPIGSQNPLAAGWAAETFEGFAFGGFRQTKLAEGVDGPSATGELPTETFANPTDEEAAALEDVGGIFGFSLEDDRDGGGFF